MSTNALYLGAISNSEEKSNNIQEVDIPAIKGTISFTIDTDADNGKIRYKFWVLEMPLFEEDQLLTTFIATIGRYCSRSGPFKRSLINGTIK